MKLKTQIKKIMIKIQIYNKWVSIKISELIIMKILLKYRKWMGVLKKYKNKVIIFKLLSLCQNVFSVLEF